MLPKKSYCFLQAIQKYHAEKKRIYIYGVNNKNITILLYLLSQQNKKNIEAIIVEDGDLPSQSLAPYIALSECSLCENSVIILAPFSFESKLFKEAKMHFNNRVPIISPYTTNFLGHHQSIPINTIDDCAKICIDDMSLTLWSPTNDCKNRAKTFFTKEPETIEWIDTFPEHSILWDIGANIGIYTLYASLRSHTVFSFEPEISNFQALVRNIEINQTGNITPCCAAISKQNCIGNLHLSDSGVGKALHCFYQMNHTLTNGDSFLGKQPCIGISIDSLLHHFSIPTPNYIKIDVDGIEEDILLGAITSLQRDELKGLMVELDIQKKDQNKRIFQMLSRLGFRYEVRLRSSMFANSRFASNYNHFFVKN
jgi:FkbM family methyltransferase